MAADGQFRRSAVEVAQGVAELLCARVDVMDSASAVVVSSEPRDKSRYHLESPEEVEFLNLPLEIGGHSARISVYQPRNDEAASPRVAKALIELVLNQRSAAVRLEEVIEPQTRLVRELVRGQIANEEEWLGEARQLGIVLSEPRVALLVDASSFVAVPHSMTSQTPMNEARLNHRARVISGEIHRVFESSGQVVHAHMGNGEFVIVKDCADARPPGRNGNGNSEPVGSPWSNLDGLKRGASVLLQRLREDTNTSINMGVGRIYSGMAGVAHSYEDARVAAELGRTLYGWNRVYSLDELGIAPFVGLSNEHTKRDLAMHLLKPLDKEPELLETLSVYFQQNCSPSQVAQTLAIHRNTLAYRLNRIETLIGLDPRNFDEAVQIRLAMLLRRLAQPVANANDSANAQRPISQSE